jgi:hypothetical protein
MCSLALAYTVMATTTCHFAGRGDDSFGVWRTQQETGTCDPWPNKGNTRLLKVTALTADATGFAAWVTVVMSLRVDVLTRCHLILILMGALACLSTLTATFLQIFTVADCGKLNACYWSRGAYSFLLAFICWIGVIFGFAAYMDKSRTERVRNDRLESNPPVDEEQGSGVAISQRRRRTKPVGDDDKDNDDEESRRALLKGPESHPPRQEGRTKKGPGIEKARRQGRATLILSEGDKAPKNSPANNQSPREGPEEERSLAQLKQTPSISTASPNSVNKENDKLPITKKDRESTSRATPREGSQLPKKGRASFGLRKAGEGRLVKTTVSQYKDSEGRMVLEKKIEPLKVVGPPLISMSEDEHGRLVKTSVVEYSDAEGKSIIDKTVELLDSSTDGDDSDEECQEEIHSDSDEECKEEIHSDSDEECQEEIQPFGTSGEECKEEIQPIDTSADSDSSYVTASRDWDPSSLVDDMDSSEKPEPAATKESEKPS